MIIFEFSCVWLTAYHKRVIKLGECNKEKQERISVLPGSREPRVEACSGVSRLLSRGKSPDLESEAPASTPLDHSLPLWSWQEWCCSEQLLTLHLSHPLCLVVGVADEITSLSLSFYIFKMGITSPTSSCTFL